VSHLQVDWIKFRLHLRLRADWEFGLRAKAKRPCLCYVLHSKRSKFCFDNSRASFFVVFVTGGWSPVCETPKPLFTSVVEPFFL
jgi:hypothetical protein